MKPLRGIPRDALALRVRLRREDEEFWRIVRSILHGYALSMQSRSECNVTAVPTDILCDSEDE